MFTFAANKQRSHNVNQALPKKLKKKQVLNNLNQESSPSTFMIIIFNIAQSWYNSLLKFTVNKN